MQIFENKMFDNLRTIMIDSEPWFVGKDVTKALGYGNGNKNSKALNNAIINHVDEEDKGIAKMMTRGGKQKTTIINESGLYTLIFNSKLPLAKQFKRWIIKEALPTIHKTEAYMTPFVSQKASKDPEYLQYIVDLLSQDKRRQLLITKETVKLHDEYHEWSNKVITPLLDGITSYEQEMQKQLQEVIA